MIEFKLIEDAREITVTLNHEDLSWTKVVEEIVTFLHACSYVFVKEDVVDEINRFKEEIQQAELPLCNEEEPF